MTNYASTDQLKEYLGITSAADDALLELLLTDATRIIEDYCHRQFAVSTDTTRYIDAVGMHIEGGMLYVADFGDICSITTVTNGDNVEVTSSQYTTYPKTLTQDEPVYETVKILSSSEIVWSWSDDWENAISITGKWGFSQSPPDAVRRACIRMAAFLYHQKDNQVFDVTAIEQGVVIRPQGMPPDVALMLQRYVRR